MQFRLMTYNIHKGIGGIDRRYDLSRIVQVIEHYQPNVVFLQEVDRAVLRSAGDDQIERLATELDYPFHAYQANVAVRGGHYGNGILSRFPLSEHNDLDLKISIKKNRRAIVVLATLSQERPEQLLVLCNAHLGLSGFERTAQIKRILKHDLIADSELPVVIGGDFNDVWSEHGRKLMQPLGFSNAANGAKTFPAALPIRGLDAIYYRGKFKLLNSYAGRINPARQASDHLPLLADFQM